MLQPRAPDFEGPPQPIHVVIVNDNTESLVEIGHHGGVNSTGARTHLRGKTKIMHIFMKVGLSSRRTAPVY